MQLLSQASHPDLSNMTATVASAGDAAADRRSRRWALAFLLLGPPAIAELLSGSAPPLQFFHPIGLAVLVLLYGGGTLLTRELRVRWGLQWAVLLPAVAYGILEEGTAIQSFFNHNHVDLRALAHYGLIGGVQWPWTLQLIFYHATVSTLIPITIADLLWPELRRVPLLARRGWVATALGVGLASLFLVVVVIVGQRTMADPYEPTFVLVGGSALVVAALVGLAYALRRSVVRPHGVPLLPPVVFGLVAFFAQALNIIVPGALADRGVAATTAIGVQLLGLMAALLFASLQICHPRITQRHLLALVCGSLLWFVALTPVHELHPAANPDPTDGMLAVGLVALTLLVLLWRRVVRTPRTLPAKG